jgi:hypothetical protein
MGFSEWNMQFTQQPNREEVTGGWKTLYKKGLLHLNSVIYYKNYELNEKETGGLCRNPCGYSKLI